MLIARRQESVQMLLPHMLVCLVNGVSLSYNSTCTFKVMGKRITLHMVCSRKNTLPEEYKILTRAR